MSPVVSLRVGLVAGGLLGLAGRPSPGRDRAFKYIEWLATVNTEAPREILCYRGQQPATPMSRRVNAKAEFQELAY